MSFVDPTGKIFGIDDIFIIGAYALYGAIKGYSDSGGDLGYAFSGACQGAISAGASATISGFLGNVANSTIGMVGESKGVDLLGKPLPAVKTPGVISPVVQFGTHVALGGVIGGVSNLANDKNFFEGFAAGAASGAAVWAGGYLSTKDFFGAGLLGNAIYSGGFSVLENLASGNEWNSSYTAYFGPLSLTYSKGSKPKYGISSISSL